MAALLQFMEDRREAAVRRERVFRDRMDPLDMYTDIELIKRYRLPRHLLLSLVDATRTDMERDTKRSIALPAHLQVLASLRVLATGTFQRDCGDIHGISQPSISRVLHRTTTSICQRMAGCIRFPNGREERQHAAEECHQMHGFPNVIGVIDGSLIPIKAPSVDEYLYVCRKGYHAVNVQAVCSAKMSFTSLVCKYPGSTHDAFIWNGCSLARRFREGDLQQKQWWLLGDSGYPLQPYLLTPIGHPGNPAEYRYNRSHKQTRYIIERAFGVLKSRFRVIHKSGGCLMYDPLKCVKIINSVFILHNLCVENNIPLYEDEDNIQLDDDDINIYNGHINDGRATRQELIMRRFQN